MKFGKLSYIEDIDFSLPPDATLTAEALHNVHRPERLDVRAFVGCTGWSMKEWVGKVYPKGTPAKDYLKAYGRQFNTIELNTTHYRIPTPDTIRKWYAETPPDFKFCPKIPQNISHSTDLGIGSDALLQFCEVIIGLEEKLGCCFIQLPPYFGFDRLTLLERFLQHFPGNIPLAIELRHKSWFDLPQHLTRWMEVLIHYGRPAVITDVAGRRDVLHMGLTAPLTMIRFVGNDLHPTDFSRVTDWVNRLADWAIRGLEEIYFFTHEPDNLHAPQLAHFLIKQIHERAFARTRGPQLEQSGQEGQQMSLF